MVITPDLLPKGIPSGLEKILARKAGARWIIPGIVYPFAGRPGSPRGAARRHAASHGGVMSIPDPVCQYAGQAGSDYWQRRGYFYFGIKVTLSLRYDKNCIQSLHF